VQGTAQFMRVGYGYSSVSYSRGEGVARLRRRLRSENTLQATAAAQRVEVITASDMLRAYEDIGDGALLSLVEEVGMNIVTLGYLVEFEYFHSLTVRDDLAVDLVRVDECLGFLGE